MTTTATPTTVPTLADAIRTFLTRFVAFPDEAMADILTLWIMHTWTFEAAQATPYLYVTSGGPQSGKTRTIEAASVLVRNPLPAGSVTASAMFWAIDPPEKNTGDDEYFSDDTVQHVKPTMFVDEVDTVFTGKANEELRNVLNTGYTYKGATLRNIGREVRSFSTFCPKLLAGIDNGHLPDTIADRAITLFLKRTAAGHLERFRMRTVEPQAQALRDALNVWATTARIERMKDAEPEFMEELTDRAFDIAEPLIIIADELSNEWGTRARQSLITLLSKNIVKETPLTMILRAVQEWHSVDPDNRTFIASADLEELTGVPTRRIGHILTPHGAKSTVTTIKEDGKPKSVRGYHYHELKTIHESM